MHERNKYLKEMSTYVKIFKDGVTVKAKTDKYAEFLKHAISPQVPLGGLPCVLERIEFFSGAAENEVFVEFRMRTYENGASEPKVQTPRLRVSWKTLPEIDGEYVFVPSDSCEPALGEALAKYLNALSLRPKS